MTGPSFDFADFPFIRVFNSLISTSLANLANLANSTPRPYIRLAFPQAHSRAHPQAPLR